MKNYVLLKNGYFKTEIFVYATTKYKNLTKKVLSLGDWELFYKKFDNDEELLEVKPCFPFLFKEHLKRNSSKELRLDFNSLPEKVNVNSRHDLSGHKIIFSYLDNHSPFNKYSPGNIVKEIFVVFEFSNNNLVIQIPHKPRSFVKPIKIDLIKSCINKNRYVVVKDNKFVDIKVCI